MSVSTSGGTNTGKKFSVLFFTPGTRGTWIEYDPELRRVGSRVPDNWLLAFYNHHIMKHVSGVQVVLGVLWAYWCLII